MTGPAKDAMPQQSGDPRFTWGLIIEVFDVLEAHGYRRGDDRHTGAAVGDLLGLARTYEGVEDDSPAAAADKQAGS